MEVAWSLELDGSVLVLRSGPRFTSGDLENAVRAAAKAPGARLPFAVLWDNRGSEESATQDEIKRRVELVAAHPHSITSVVAIVVDDALHFGLARMGASHAENRGISVEIFEDLESARQWLARTLKGDDPR